MSKKLMDKDGRFFIDMICLNCKYCQLKPIDKWMKRFCDLNNAKTYISSTCEHFEVKDSLAELGYKIKEEKKKKK